MTKKNASSGLILKNNTVILVEIDGVLLPGKFQMFKGNRDIINGDIKNILFDAFSIRCLNLFCKYTGTSIDVHGSWNKHKSKSELKTIFDNNGFTGIWSDHNDTSDQLIIKSDYDCFLDTDNAVHLKNHIMVDDLDGFSYTNLISVLDFFSVDIGDVLEGEFF